MLTLAAKLGHLLHRKRGADGQPPSNRALSAALRALPGYTRGGSHVQIASLRTGTETNPKITTIQQLATVLDAPAPFFLPGEAWDDLEALTTFQGSADVRAIVRHLKQLSPDELARLLTQLQTRRDELGLPTEVPPSDIIPQHDSGDTTAKFRRKRTPDESAAYAADLLEGL